ncbi:HET-domain-containing protein [Cucurbitaria berberidis CBS 394.84]|uniref:HET-domain-containing protein n=1 Tax=Cucurbitaria berberidis CBS 394.84 TaxID=1168544 RepID=A0A9P4LD46_9PLEO|nr:HET-domain-containing protein [Cucurbitaria berberidis CBS 394.84]KAF1850403.1 HET-domain-containing protein [Cucurbitaria berberidis CBS 394.84]
MNELLELEILMKQEFGWAEDTPASMYSTLPTTTSIRILKVLKQPNPIGKVICQVDIVDLDSLPQYSALSYTWGDPGANPTDVPNPNISQKPIHGKYEIICNGHPVSVTKNCLSFLHAMIQWHYFLERDRSDDDSDLLKQIPNDYFWIDAICINQGSLQERSSQVRLMDRVYRQAQKVVVWLGPSDSMTEPAVKAVCAISSVSKRTCEQLLASRMLDPEVYQKLGIPLISKHEWQCLRALYDRAWFSRSWTIQEYVLSRNTVVFCGHAFLEMKWLRRAAENTAVMGWGYQLEILGTEIDTPDNTSLYMVPYEIWAAQEQSMPTNAISSSSHIWQQVHGASLRSGLIHRHDSTCTCKMARHYSIYTLPLLTTLLRVQNQVSRERWLNQNNTVPLQVVLQVTRQNECSNPADKLYSVLGLVPEASWQNLPIDYAMPIAELYTRAAFVMMQATQSLSILSYVGDKKCRQQKTLPSWVPDFTSPGFNSPLDIGCGLHLPITGQRLVSFDASRNMPLRLGLHESSHRTLPVSGIYYDTVHLVTQFDVCGLRFLEPLLDVIVVGPRDRLWRTLLANESVVEIPGEHIKPPFVAQTIDGEVFEFLLGTIVGGLPFDTSLVMRTSPDECSEDIGRREYAVYEKIVGLEQNCIPYGRLYSEKESVLFSPLQYRYSPEEVLCLIQNFLQSLHSRMQDRDLFTTKNCRIGTGMRSTQEGDEIWVLAGGKVPYVLRPKGNAQYELIGEAYLHDIMYGELVKEMGDMVKDIVLV